MSSAIPAFTLPASRPAPRERSLGKVLLVASALALLGVLATFDAWRDIVRIARRDEEQSHVFLVPLVAAWLVWVRRERLRDYVPSATWVGPVLVVAGWLVNRIGDDHLVQSMWHGGALLVVVGAFLSVAGGGLVLRFAPVFLALCFLVPVPGRVRQGIAMPLESATAALTQMSLDTLGVPVERWGNTLRINGHDVTIAEACNGLRMAFALMMVTFGFAYGAPLKGWVRVLLVAASPLLAILFNVIRLVPTVWAFGSLSQQMAETFHDWGGWLMLPLAFFSLVGLMRLLRWAQIPVTPYVLAHGS